MKRSRRALLRTAALSTALGAAGCNQSDGQDGSAGGGNDGGDGDDGGGATEGTAEDGGDGTDGTETDTPTERPVGTNERWPQFQAGLANTGAVPLFHGDSRSVERRWTVTLDEPGETQPAFDEERIYVSTHDAVYGIDRETQERLWRFDVAEEKPNTVAVDGRGFVYAVTSRGVYKIDGEEGWSAWEFNFTEEFPDLISVVAKSAPVLYGNSVAFNLILKRNGTPSTVSRTVAVHRRRAEQQWQWQANRGATVPETVYAPTPAGDGGSLYVTVGHDKRDAALYSVRRDNGNQRWRTDYRGKGWSSAAVTAGSVYFADKFAQRYTTAGKRAVRRAVEPPPNAYGVAVGSEHVFMSARVWEGNEGSLYAINDLDQVDWTFEGEGNLYVPTATFETLYVASGSGDLFALGQEEGLVRWSHDLGIDGTTVASGPTVSTDEIYLVARPSTGSATLYAVSPE